MRKKRHPFRRLMLLVFLCGALALGWMYLRPLMSDAQQTAYASYTVRQGNIATTKSFSASINVLNSETLTNTTGASSIREVYVQAGQEVHEGDKLMLLEDGELLRAGLDGVVNDMRYSVGDTLRQNVQLIQICDLTHLQVTLSVDEYDVRGVSAGQKCIVSILPLGLDFETEITHVNRVSSASGQVAYYTATAEITVPPSVLPGMTASVTMPDQRAENVLLLDMAALGFEDDRSAYVLRQNGDGYTKVPVTTGLSDGMQVEIVSGLSLGDEVWAEAGTETVASAITLTELYKKLFGEKVVINNMNPTFSRGSARPGGGEGSFSRPEGAGQGSFRSEGLSTPSDMGEDFPFGSWDAPDVLPPEGWGDPNTMPDGASPAAPPQPR